MPKEELIFTKATNNVKVKQIQQFDLSKAKKIGDKTNKKDIENPYLDARIKQRDLVSKVKTSSLLFALIAVVALFIALMAVGGLIATAGKSKFIPYVVAVDDHGMAVVSGIAKPIEKIDEKLIVAFLSEFIINLRTVSVDAQLLRRNIFSVYSHLNQQDVAQKKVDEFLSTGEGKGSPFERAATEIVSVKVISVLQQTPSTYQVDWIETTRGRDGSKLNPDQPMRALITYYRGEIKSDIDDVILNPLGLYISDFNITQLQQINIKE